MFSDNISDKYYTDGQCIACDACIVETPGFLRMKDNDGHACVITEHRQPKKPLKAKMLWPPGQSRRLVTMGIIK